MSLYGRLFRYKARLDREPLEDFLSEALADLLGRMGEADTVAFLNWAFENAKVKVEWSALQWSQREWRTQVALPGGIADIVLFLAGKPVLVIENKTWSSFQDHGTEEEAANQVTTYCRWLSEAAEDRQRVGVLLVTGTLIAPEGYHDEAGAYAVRARGQVTWASVQRWLRQQLNSEQQEVASWGIFAQELIEFLGEKNLSSEVFVNSDVSSAMLMLQSMERWESTFQMIWAATADITKQFLKSRTSELRFMVNGGMLWQYKYGADGVTPEKAYLGVALRFPEHSQWFLEAGLPQYPQLMMMVLSDAGHLTTSKPLPAGWVQDEEGFSTAKGVHEFSLSADQRIDELQRWAVDAMAGARDLMLNSILKD